MEMEKSIEIITEGRAGIDLNTTALNTKFADVKSFEKSVGGSPANIIQGTARLGLKSDLSARFPVMEWASTS